MAKNEKPKSINALMKYLRDKKNICIEGSVQKRKLMNMGYYHGYKGYRYIGKPSNQVQYCDFDELFAVYDFDAKLKALFYPSVMFIETALKNYVLEVIIDETKSSNFTDIYDQVLDNHKMFSTFGKTFKNGKDQKSAEDKFKKAVKKRLDLRTKINNIQAKAYGNDNKIASHYLSKDNLLPIWGIFELITLGEFGTFVSCMNKKTRESVSKKLKIKQSDDSNAMMTQKLIFVTRDLRNAIAHNDVIFDTRFKTSSIDNSISSTLKNSTGISDVKFDTITDYLVLIIYQLKLLEVTKTELKKIINEFEDLVGKLRKSIPTSVFDQIIHTDHFSKISKLRKFI